MGSHTSKGRYGNYGHFMRQSRRIGEYFLEKGKGQVYEYMEMRIQIGLVCPVCCLQSFDNN